MRLTRHFAAALAAASLLTLPAAGQDFGDILRGAARKAAQRETARQIDKTVRKVVRCVFGDEECAARAKREGKEVEVVPADAGMASGGSGSGSAAANTNYDFVPGTRVLFEEDFRSERIGNFPRTLRLLSGNMEIAEIRGSRYLRSTGYGSFIVPLPETLPEKFTIELDYSGTLARGLEILTSEFRKNAAAYPHSYALINDSMAGITSGRTSAIKNPGPQALVVREWKPADTIPVRLMADGDYVKMYADGVRIANVPNAKLPRTRFIQINLRGNERKPALLGNLRIAAGDTTIYDALLERGRVATHGILFDTGSHVIRPESGATLTEIGQMLRDHPELRLRIEGHTDNTGSAATNQQLSEARARAIRDHIVQRFGIDGSRLEAVGYGDTRPVASNNTSSGRQQNRRVELVKR